MAFFYRRNQNYLDILRLLSLGDKQLSSFDISLRFTHLFWLGDLNYRLDMDIQVEHSHHTHQSELSRPLTHCRFKEIPFAPFESACHALLLLMLRFLLDDSSLSL